MSSEPAPECASAVLSIAPVVLASPARGVDLELRISAPTVGEALPIILFSHGNGQSLHAYGPLADYWAAHGFVVFQPTHLDSRTLRLAPDDPRRSRFWHHREQDLVSILDALDQLESEVPFIAGRLDRTRIAVAGHSWGGQTASTLIGATHPDPDDDTVVCRKDARIKAGVLMAVPGKGGDSLSARAAQAYPFMHPDFSDMTVPVLVVSGDRDQGGLSKRGPGWWRDAYDLSPSPKALFMAFGGEHALGGIPGYEARETTDERPERVAAIRLITTAFLRSSLYAGDPAWEQAIAAVRAAPSPEGRIETK